MRITKLEAVEIARALFAAADEEPNIERERAIVALACTISDYSHDKRAGEWSPNIPGEDMTPEERARRIWARHHESVRKRTKGGHFNHYLF